MDTKIKITYLGHSGFLVKLSDTYLLFDYYIGKLPVFPKDSKIFVFVSHRHEDHFNTEIFKLSEKYNVTFFLAYDIKLNAYGMRRYRITNNHMKHIVPVRFNEDITINTLNIQDATTQEFTNKTNADTNNHKAKTNPDGLRIRTFKSTDSGVAYLVSLYGKHIYHAGDLNWWHWSEEGNCYNNNMTANYKREIDKLANTEDNIDIAFVPLDPRLGDSYYYGLKYFCETISVPVIFPMHFWNDYGCRNRFINKYGYGERIMAINYPGQIFSI